MNLQRFDLGSCLYGLLWCSSHSRKIPRTLYLILWLMHVPLCRLKSLYRRLFHLFGEIFVVIWIWSIICLFSFLSVVQCTARKDFVHGYMYIEGLQNSGLCSVPLSRERHFSCHSSSVFFVSPEGMFQFSHPARHA